MGYKANITSNLLNQIIRVVLGALTSILVARTLGPSGQGYVAYVLLIFTLVGNYGHMGLNSAVMYFLKRSGTDPERLMGNNFTALLLTWLLISAVLLALRSFGVVLGDYNYFYILGGLVLVLATFIYYNHHAWFTADEHHLAAAFLDALPHLFEHREFGRAPHEWAAAANKKLSRKRWRHPLRHFHNVAAQPPSGR